jgi:hypothetical protein
MTTANDFALASTRRQFFGRAAGGIGTLALSSLLNAHGGLTHFAPKAKRIIYLFMQGGPSQLDLFDPKPGLAKRHGEELPESIRKGQRLTTMTSKQTSLPVAPSPFRFVQHGQSGAWVSELLPHTARIADELCIIRSMNSEAINHDPAITFLQTGHQQPGSVTAWARKTAICRRLSCSSRAAARCRPPIRSTRGFGAVAFCRRIIKA